MRVLFLTNIPVPYRIDFYNQLGKKCDLTVVFEAKRVEGINFDWNDDKIENFKAIFLSDGNINEGIVNKDIFKYIDKKKYDVIVATNYSYRTEMAGIIYMKLKRIPYLMETDGGIIKYGESTLKRLYKKFLVSGAKYYFSPSKMSDEYLAYYGAKRDRIRRYSFSSMKNSDVLDRVISYDEKLLIRSDLKIPYKKVLLAVGQFIHRKGFDILLKACRNIDDNIGVYIVGGQPTKEYINMKEEYGLNNVHFVGFKNKIELAQYFKMADVFVLPTREDIWGKGLITKAFFEKKSTIDYIGAVQGIPICFDAKETNQGRLPLQNVHPHQIEFMEAFVKQGGVAFLLVHCQDKEEYYFLPFSVLKKYWDISLNGGRKSIPYSAFEQRYRVYNKMGCPVHYLEAVKVYLEQEE